ncbi:MAG TPA: tetratricopeptide repeat protein [Gemmatimonadaceae bacterium]|jgi:TolA-binding protein
MTNKLLSVVALAALPFLAASCVASKGDIRLLQDELRATRQQLALGDTSILRADDARRNQIAQLSTKLDRAIDSLGKVANRLAMLSANASGSFEQIQQQVGQMQAMLGQTTRNLQETRSQVQILSERGTTTTPPPPDPTAAPAAVVPSGVPGAATLYSSALESINQGAFATGRRSLEQLLTTYPTDDRAPRAMLKIGEAYRAEGNTAASDSVYRVVADKFPKTDEAGLALYRVGKALWDSGKRSEGRILLNRVIRDHPNTDAAQLARATLQP